MSRGKPNNQRLNQLTKEPKKSRADSGITYEPSMNIFQNINDKRKRGNIPKSVIQEVKKNIASMNFKPKKKKHPTLFWGGANNNEEAITLDLPIIYVDAKKKGTSYIFDERTKVKPKWRLINKSCIVVDKITNRLLAVFIYSKDDKNIGKVLDMCENDELIKDFDKYYPKKKAQFYSGFSSKKDKETGKQIKLPHLERYGGRNYLEGLQRYLDGTVGHNIFSYYPRAVEANTDKVFLKRLLTLYCGLYQLEKVHCPQVAKFRLDIAKKVNYIGAFTPSCPLELCPATSMGASINFASYSHDDSSVKGTTETIIWRPNKKSKEPYIFANSIAELYFDINDDCMIYQVGTDSHSTLDTGNHGGAGYVLLSKSILLYDTPYTEKWYNLWRRWFKSN